MTQRDWTAAETKTLGVFLNGDEIRARTDARRGDRRRLVPPPLQRALRAGRVHAADAALRRALAGRARDRRARRRRRSARARPCRCEEHSLAAAAARLTFRGMCRNIRTLYNFDPPTSSEEIDAAALQYVRKVSGMTKPSQANEDGVQPRRPRDRAHHAAPPRRSRHDRRTEGPRGRGGTPPRPRGRPVRLVELDNVVADADHAADEDVGVDPGAVARSLMIRGCVIFSR